MPRVGFRRPPIVPIDLVVFRLKTAENVLGRMAASTGACTDAGGYPSVAILCAKKYAAAATWRWGVSEKTRVAKRAQEADEDEVDEEEAEAECDSTRSGFDRSPQKHIFNIFSL